MSELQGSAAKAAYKPAVDWGTAVTLGDGDQVEYASEDILPDPQLVVSDQITGNALPGAAEIGNIIVQGSLKGMDLKYEGHERLVHAVMGNNTTSGSTGVFQHKMNFALSNAGQFGTLAIEKVVSGPHEVDTFKPMGMTLVAEAGKAVRMDIRGIGRQLRMEDPDRENDASTTWTLPGVGGAPSVRRLVKFGQITTQIGPQSDGTPVYVDYCVKGFQLVFNRNGDPVQTTCDGDYASEPATDTVEITAQFDFPIYDTDNHPLVQARQAGTVLTAKITFDSGVVLGGGMTNYRWIIWLPAFQLTGGYPNISDLGRVPLTVNGTLHSSSVAVDTDAVMPRIYIHNGIADIADYTNS